MSGQFMMEIIQFICSLKHAVFYVFPCLRLHVGLAVSKTSFVIDNIANKQSQCYSNQMGLTHPSPHLLKNGVHLL